MPFNVCFCLFPAGADAADLNDLNIPFTLRTKSEYFTLQSAKDADRAGFLVFRVRTPHEFYQVETLPELHKRLHEIEVIEKIRFGKVSGGGFAGGAADTLVSTGEGAVNLVTHPIQSGKNIGSAVGKVGRGIGGIFTEKDEAEKSSFDDSLFGGAQRELARDLGVDVYTRNQVLRTMLSEMAYSRTGGKGAATVGKFLLPGGILVTSAVGAGTLNSVADELVNSQSRGDLYASNKQALEDMGFLDPDIQIFLNKKFYTPREITYLRFYLEQLKTSAGYYHLFRRVLKLDRRWESRELLYAAELSAEAARALKGSLRFEAYDDGMSIENKEQLIFLAPYDYLDAESGPSKRILARLKVLKSLKPGRAYQIRVSGQASEEFSAACEQQGVEVKSWMLFKTLTPNQGV